jgi:hypothetical protein
MEELGRPDCLFEDISKPFPGTACRADERRQHPRKGSLIPVSVLANQTECRGDILNISAGGVFIGAVGGVPPDREIVMTFEHPSIRRRLSIVGRIAWTNPKGIGVRFKRVVQNGEDFPRPPEGGGSLHGEQKREVKSMGRIKTKRICWEPSMSPDVVKYRLYWSEDGLIDYTSKFVDLGNVVEVMIPDDIPSFPRIKGDVALGITAVNDVGNESDMAKMTANINFLVPDPPKNLMVEEV